MEKVSISYVIAAKIVVMLFVGCAHSMTSSQDDNQPTTSTTAVAVTSLTQDVYDGLDDLNNLFSQKTIQGDYLGLGRIDSAKKYSISMCPMNSSGDIYHILAYVILSSAHSKDIPPIILTYDGKEKVQKHENEMNTFSQVDRSLKFCEWLGYQEYFLPLQKVEAAAYYQNVRQFALRTTLKSGGYTHYADQKILTTVIAKYFKQDWYGTVGALRNGFAQYDQKNEHLNSVKQASLQEVERIKSLKNSKPLVVIHIRYSSNANETQNSLVDLKRMKQLIEDKGQSVWFVFADGRVRGSFNEIITANRTNVFPYPHPTKKYAASSTSSLDGTIDYGKFYHLQLLLELLGLGSDVKFVGNTKCLQYACINRSH